MQSYDEEINYSELSFPLKEPEWYYDCEKLEAELKETCIGHVLKKIYVTLDTFLDSDFCNERYFASELDGGCYLFFDDFVLCFCINGEGMVGYCMLEGGEVSVKNVSGKPPAGLGLEGDNYYYAISERFVPCVEEQRVKEVNVEATDYYPFVLCGFEREKAEKAVRQKKLPNGIRFALANGVTVALIASSLEYYDITLYTDK